MSSHLYHALCWLTLSKIVNLVGTCDLNHDSSCLSCRMQFNKNGGRRLLRNAEGEGLGKTLSIWCSAKTMASSSGEQQTAVRICAVIAP